MVEESSPKLHRISFEEIRKTLRASKSVRAAVIRYLAQEFGSEVTKHFAISSRSATRKSSKNK